MFCPRKKFCFQQMEEKIMGRYEKADILQTAIDKQNEQQHLKDKHNIQDKNVVVVEKTHIFKWFALLIRIIFSIALFIMAAIGTFTLLYPELRTAFINILTEILNSIGGK